MTPTEVAALLTLAAVYDNRAIAEATVHAWDAALHGMDFETGRAAVIEHYATSTRWIMPADINAYAKAERDREHEETRKQDLRAITDGRGPLAPNQAWLERKLSERRNSVRALQGPTRFGQAMAEMKTMLETETQRVDPYQDTKETTK